MKIGIVCYPTFGGSGVMATELGLALADKGHDIHFITYNQPVRLVGFRPNIYYHEVKVPTYPLFEFPPYETALASAMLDVIVNNKLDVLHVHYAIPHASSAYFAKQMLLKMGINIPYITTLHGTDITLVGKDATYKPVVQFSINESDAVTAVSYNLREETMKFFDIKKEIHVIYNFVDNKRFYQNHKDHFKKLIAPHGERILVHVSNFRKVKRVPDVIAAFKIVRDAMPARLLMIGDGPERAAAEDLCRSLGICQDIRFMGKQDQMEEIYNIADLFVLPSDYESFGLAALEAMSCGIPVISSNAGGLPEINISGGTGLLSDVGDIEQLGANAIEILKDDETLQRYREGALAQADKFNIDMIVPQYEALYENVISRCKKEELA